MTQFPRVFVCQECYEEKPLYEQDKSIEVLMVCKGCSWAVKMALYNEANRY